MFAEDNGQGKGEAPEAQRLFASIAVCVLAFVASVSIWLTQLLAPLDHAFIDFQTRWLQRESPSDVAIVEIDARSIKELERWPFPRGLHAEVLRNLEAAGAKSIFLDIDFSSPSTSEQDEQLAIALARASKTTQLILPAFWQPTSDGATSLLLSEPMPAFRQHVQLGLVNLMPGVDGLVREVPAFSELPAQAQPVWRVLNPDSAHDTLQLDYRQSPRSYQRVSYVDILEQRNIEALRGKIVFVGATALELGDIVAVPVHRALPGVIVQAIAYDSAQRERLSAPSGAWMLSMILAWTVFVAGLLLLRRASRSIVVAAAAVAAGLSADVVAYAAFNVIVPVSPFIVTVLVTLLGSLLASLSVEKWLSWWALRRTREQDTLLRRIVEQSSDAILALDENHIIRTANPAARTILGGRDSVLVGRALADIAPALIALIHSSDQEIPGEVWLDVAGSSGVAVQVSRARLEWENQQITTLTLRDVTAQRAREAELRHLAMHDALTGLPNRVSLAKRLEEALSTRAPSDVIALMMLDLDGFKEVNDTLGHSTGDYLMRELGSRLMHLATDDRHIARLGGDEFAVLWRVQNVDAIGELAQQLLLMIQEPIVIKGIPVSLGTSIGIATCPEHAQDAESLLKRADVALYSAKRRHTSVEFYEASNDTNSPRRLEMLSKLRAAVGNNELFLEYQPKVSMSSGVPVEVEALCRWQSPTFGRVAPGEFIALAEASDVIKPLTEWTIRKALTDCRSWHDEGMRLRVAVNLSARHLQDAQLPRWLETTFHETNTRPDWLELEITESAIMTDPDRASKILRALHDLGVLLSIDDFGTGYSSLAYLRNLAVNRLKLDRSFINGMNAGMKDQVIVESTIKLAHGLELEVVAEGIENEFQYHLLRKFGCDLAQGYWIARPMPVEQLFAWHGARVANARIARPAFGTSPGHKRTR